MALKRLVVTFFAALHLSTGFSLWAKELSATSSTAPSDGFISSPEGWAETVVKDPSIMGQFFRLLKAEGENELLKQLREHALWRIEEYKIDGKVRKVLLFTPIFEYPGTLIAVLTDERYRFLSWCQGMRGESADLTSDGDERIISIRGPFGSTGLHWVQHLLCSSNTIVTQHPAYFAPVIPPIKTREESEFFAQLRRSNAEGLMKDLGVITSTTNRDFQLDSDPKKWNALGPKRLKWHGTLGEGDNLARVLILDAGFDEWPGLQYVTIVLTDRQYRVRSWRTAGGREKFRAAEILREKGDWQLRVTFEELPRKASSVIQYTIRDSEILHSKDPTFDPPRSISGSEKGEG